MFLGQLLLDNQLEMEKVRGEGDRKKVTNLTEQLKESVRLVILLTSQQISSLVIVFFSVGKPTLCIYVFSYFHTGSFHAFG